jgi:hypothetical protein
MRAFSRDSNAPADSVFFWDNTIFYQLALDTDRSLRVYRMQVYAYVNVLAMAHWPRARVRVSIVGLAWQLLNQLRAVVRL